MSQPEQHASLLTWWLIVFSSAVCLLSLRPTSQPKLIPVLWFELRDSGPLKVWANTILTESSHELCHGGLIWIHSVSSQGTHKMSSHCEIAVGFLWVCLNVFVICQWEKQKLKKNFKLTLWACCEIFVRLSDDSPCRGSSGLTVRVANSQKAHSKLTMSSSCVYTVSWINVLKMSSPWPMPGELSVTITWAPSELAVISNSSLRDIANWKHEKKNLYFVSGSTSSYFIVFFSNTEVQSTIKYEFDESCVIKI